MIFIKKLSAYSRNAFIYMTLLGIALLIFGGLLLVMPELLAYLISFFFIFGGLVILSIAWRLKQTEKNIRHKVEEVTDTFKSEVSSIKDTFDQF